MFSKKFFVYWTLLAGFLSFIIPTEAKVQESNVFLVDRALLRQADMRMLWQVNLPVKKGEGVSEIYLFEDNLYVLSGNNYLMAVNRQDGVIRFAFDLASKGLGVCEPVYYKDKLWFMVGNELAVIDPVTGKIEERTYLDVLGRSSASNIAINQRYLYVAGATKRLHALVKDGMWMEFQVTADDNSEIRSIKANNDIVVFSTQTGHVVGMTAAGPKRLWQVDVIGQIWSSMVMEDEWVYVGSANTKLYKFNVQSGERGWVLPVQLGDVIVKPCRVGEKTLYQMTANGDIFGVDKEKGKVLWKVKNGIGFVSEEEHKAYVLAKPGILHVMNNETGKKEFSVNFSNVSDSAVNLVDSTIYVSDEKGRLAAIVQD